MDPYERWIYVKDEDEDGDEEESVRSLTSSSAESFGEEQNCSIVDQVQHTSAVFKCRRIDKRSDQVQVSEWTKRTSNTVALDEKNRAKMVKYKPARPEEGQLGEEKIGSRDLVKLYAYERDEAASRMISWKKSSWEGNQLGNKLGARKCLSVMNKLARCKETSWLSSNEPGKNSSGQEQERIEQEQLCTRSDDKRKLEISSRAIASKSSGVEEATSSNEQKPAMHEKTKDGKYNNVIRLSTATTLCPTDKSPRQAIYIKSRAQAERESTRRAKSI
ncbi:hypothetical protein F511_16482 [Dorcoceras hygrometricum]|uniref:Uncharacterized protein n=1 Tax=Dorcoceras hygrometricum TaxID=472368 RepID=A0A2Z7D356_9LAMI|nr:hypothetical protein F511_16482 [Dorcoceras hygrometricum]